MPVHGGQLRTRTSRSCHSTPATDLWCVLLRCVPHRYRCARSTLPSWLLVTSAVYVMRLTVVLPAATGWCCVLRSPYRRWCWRTTAIRRGLRAVGCGTRSGGQHVPPPPSRASDSDIDVSRDRTVSVDTLFCAPRSASLSTWPCELKCNNALVALSPPVWSGLRTASNVESCTLGHRRWKCLLYT